jgi:hypothetical protein
MAHDRPFSEIWEEIERKAKAAAEERRAREALEAAEQQAKRDAERKHVEELFARLHASKDALQQTVDQLQQQVNALTVARDAAKAEFEEADSRRRLAAAEADLAVRGITSDTMRTSSRVAKEGEPPAHVAAMAAAIAERLNDGQGFAFSDGLVDRTAVATARGRMLELFEGGEADSVLRFSPGRVGGGRAGSESSSVTETIRSDYVAWISGEEETSLGVTIQSALDMIDCVVLDRLAGERPMVGELRGRRLFRERVMLAVYPPGGHYQLHVDNPSTIRNGRILTAILYLNPEWTAEHGGELELYPPGSTNKTLEDSAPVARVEPVGGRLLVFWSDARNPHRVLPAAVQHRCAITCWYMDACEASEALSAASRSDLS